MNIEIGYIVQTNLYAKSGYAGRKLFARNIQTDVEPDNDVVRGTCVKKDGTLGLQELSCLRKNVKQA